MLSSKHMALAGRVIKSAVKIGICVNIDESSKFKLKGKAPQINLKVIMGKKKKYVLVFDDMERCSVPIKLLLDYIIHLVEQGDYKVIAVLNRSKITEKLKKKAPDSYWDNMFINIESPQSGASTIMRMFHKGQLRN